MAQESCSLDTAQAFPALQIYLYLKESRCPLGVVGHSLLFKVANKSTNWYTYKHIILQEVYSKDL